MTKAERTANMIGVVLPFLGLIAAVVLLWNKWVDWIDVGIMVFTYLLYGLGVTVGYHRLLTHRAFKTYKPVEYGWAIVGSMGLQGGVLDWVADHRKHHAHTDQEGDPHSPHVGHGEGIRGLWHAHTGWLFETHGQADWKKYARELYEDKGMRRINKLFPLWALYSLLSRRSSASSCTASRSRARCRASSGAAWSARSSSTTSRGRSTPICHYFGNRRFETDDLSTNVFWLALPSMGESWHHNHHAFPRSAQHGLRWWEIDISALVITGMEKAGLAWNVVRISPERQAAKEAERKEPVAV